MRRMVAAGGKKNNFMAALDRVSFLLLHQPTPLIKTAMNPN
jgi:hypothetical protein